MLQPHSSDRTVARTAYAAKWTPPSCRNFVDDQTQMQLSVLARWLGNSLLRLTLPSSAKHGSLTTRREKLITIGAKVVRHCENVTLPIAVVAVPRELFATILGRIQRFGVPSALGSALLT